MDKWLCATILALRYNNLNDTIRAFAEGARFASGPLEDRTRYEKLTSDLSAGEKDEMEREEAARRRHR